MIRLEFFTDSINLLDSCTCKNRRSTKYSSLNAAATASYLSIISCKILQTRIMIDERLKLHTKVACGDSNSTLDRTHFISFVNRLSDQKRADIDVSPFQFKGPAKSFSLSLSRKTGRTEVVSLARKTHSLANLNDETIVDPTNSRELTQLNNIRKSFISLGFSKNTQHMPYLARDIESSIIILGSNSSILFDQVLDLIIIAHCHQLRMKNVRNSLVLAQISSKNALLENCSSLLYGTLTKGMIQKPNYNISDLNWPSENYHNPSNISIERNCATFESLIKSSDFSKRSSETLLKLSAVCDLNEIHLQDFHHYIL